MLGVAEWLSSKLLCESSFWHCFELVNFGTAWAYRRRPGPSTTLTTSSSTTSSSASSAIVVPARCASGAVSESATVGAPRNPEEHKHHGKGAIRTQASSAAPSVDSLRLEGDELLASGKADDAMSSYADAIARQPLLPDLHLRLGICCLQLCERERAIEAFRRCLFLSADIWPAAFLLGDLLLTDDPAAATRYFRQAQAELLRREAARAPESALPFAPFFVGRKAALEATRNRLASLARGRQPGG